MSGPDNDLLALVRTLNKHGVEFVIIGAHAVGVHGYQRATKDLDLLVRPTPRNAKRLLRALKEFGFGSLGIKEADVLSDNVIQLGYEPNRVGLLSSIAGVGTESVWRARIPGRFYDEPAWFISRAHLLKAKEAAVRPRDIEDLRQLEALGRLRRPRAGLRRAGRRRRR